MKFIIRLDDACETMNKEMWNQMESLLDKYNIKPIIGIIPENKDKDFTWDYDSSFWTDTVKRWQNKNYIIAQHGCHHLFQENPKSEFQGFPYSKQKELLLKGNDIIKKHEVNPTCFFAPQHTYDKTTKKLFSELNLFQFISDGYALGPYRIKNTIYLPSIFDTPHKILPFGVYTFVYHPNNITKEALEYLEKFIIKYEKNFHNIPYEKYFKTRRHRYIQRGIIFCIMKIFRKIRKKKS